MVAFGPQRVSLKTESAAASAGLSQILARTGHKHKTPGGRFLAAGLELF